MGSTQLAWLLVHFFRKFLVYIIEHVTFHLSIILPFHYLSMKSLWKVMEGMEYNGKSWKVGKSRKAQKPPFIQHVLVIGHFLQTCHGKSWKVMESGGK